ncbi:hypothetical protein OSTOST_01054 [Ostertagia ostertagi]
MWLLSSTPFAGDIGYYARSENSLLVDKFKEMIKLHGYQIIIYDVKRTSSLELSMWQQSIPYKKLSEYKQAPQNQNVGRSQVVERNKVTDNESLPILTLESLLNQALGEAGRPSAESADEIELETRKKGPEVDPQGAKEEWQKTAKIAAFFTMASEIKSHIGLVQGAGGAPAMRITSSQPVQDKKSGGCF